MIFGNVAKCGLIFLILAIILFVCNSIIGKRRQRKSEIVLDKKSILLDSTILERNILILLMLFFLVMGLVSIYISNFEYNTFSSKIEQGTIMGILFVIISLLYIINTVRVDIKFFRGDFKIMIDELTNKKKVRDDHENNYWFYFKDYSEGCQVDRFLYNSSEDGDKFYLVFLKGKKSPFVFERKRYLLSEDIEDKLIKIDELNDYINKKS